MLSRSAPSQSAPTAQPARSGIVWRLLTAVVALPVLLALIWVGGALWAAVVSAAVMIGVVEFTRAFRVTSKRLLAVAVVSAGLLPLVALAGSAAVLAVLAAGTVGALIALILQGEAPESLMGWAIALAAIVYAGVLGQYAVSLREGTDGRSWLLLAILTTFATDTAAYAVGRLMGRHKLAPRLSPAKTIEGAIGGLVGGALAAWGLATLMDLGQPAGVMIALGAAAAVAGQLGDLAESLIKRTAGVKDMGSLFPGHGGVLDRLDSLLFVVPLVAVCARWLAE